ncbi:hypothetical protein ADT71_16455 [Novosphingobium sp. ST904]|nr:hypothetical protein ADT71_16455 [Novosphingobium sp. ST904]
MQVFGKVRAQHPRRADEGLVTISGSKGGRRGGIVAGELEGGGQGRVAVEDPAHHDARLWRYRQPVRTRDIGCKVDRKRAVRAGRRVERGMTDEKRRTVAAQCKQAHGDAFRAIQYAGKAVAPCRIDRRMIQQVIGVGAAVDGKGACQAACAEVMAQQPAAQCGGHHPVDVGLPFGGGVRVGCGGGNEAPGIADGGVQRFPAAAHAVAPARAVPSASEGMAKRPM